MSDVTFERWQAESPYYYTGARCARCRKLLNADGDHPAEIYAGTFNGLCYGCTSSGPYIVRVSLLDGARVLSYPPHCPSWRRDREEYTGYADCETCQGSGVQGWAPAAGGMDRYRHYCKPCIQRYSSHPVRVLAYGYSETLMRVAETAFQRRLDQASGLKKSASAKLRKEARKDLDPAVFEEVKADVKGRYNRLKARHAARVERLGMNAWRPPTAEELAA